MNRRALIAAAVLAALLVLVVVWWLLEGHAENGSAAANPELTRATEELRSNPELLAPSRAAAEPAPARSSDAHGESLVRAATPLATPEPEPFVAPPDALVIEVVDPEGTPREGISLRLDPGRSVEPAPPEPQLSDARGRVVFEALRSRLAADSEPWTLRADLPFEVPPSLLLDDAALASPLVRFVLPPGGELLVSLQELDERPAPRGSALRLKLMFPHEVQELDLKGPEWRLVQGDGPLRFPWVELARDWELSGWRPKGTEVTRLRARGPERLGEQKQLVLVLGRDHPVVSYRLLDPAGKLLPAIQIELGRATIFGGLDTSRVITDADARFTLDGRSPAFHGATLLVTYRPSEAETWMARIQLPPSPAEGWNDGGDVLLGAEPLLCAGRVVDASGRAVAEAEVLAGREQPFFGGRVLRAISGPSGRFEIRGIWLDDQVPLRAKSGRFSSPEILAAPGSEQIELVLSPRYTISGELLLPSGVEASSIQFAGLRRGERLELARKQGSLHAFFFAVSEPSPAPSAQRFELEPIEGGPLALLVLLGEHELLRLPEWNLDADRDVGPIDLRERIHLCEIELLGAEEPAQLQGELDWNVTAAEQRQVLGFHGALVRILSAQVPIDVELRAKGYRSARLEKLSGRVQHRLEPALRVRLVLRTDGAIPRAPYRFDAELYRGDVAMSQPVEPRWFTPERREIECLVSAAGPLTARWHLEKHFEGDGFGGASGAHVLEEHWVTIEVRDVPGVQVFELGLEGKVLEGVVGEMGW